MDSTSILPKSRLAELRKHLKLTQEQFAEEIGVNKNTISAVETSSRLLNIVTGIEIAEKYNVTLDWLYGLKDATKENNILNNFSDFFNLGKRTIVAQGRDKEVKVDYLTMQISPVVREYILEISEIEKINKEKDLPIGAYKAWLESVNIKYLKQIEENDMKKAVEYVLIDNDNNFGDDVAYANARRIISNSTSKKALDDLNYPIL